jgi:hypothetical protein
MLRPGQGLLDRLALDLLGMRTLEDAAEVLVKS